MEACSLLTINNEPCHRAIRAGTCCGLAKGACTNLEGVRLLTARYEEKVRNLVTRRRAEGRESRDSFPSHFVDQNDLMVTDVHNTAEATLKAVASLMERVRRVNFKKVHQEST